MKRYVMNTMEAILFLLSILFAVMASRFMQRGISEPISSKHAASSAVSAGSAKNAPEGVKRRTASVVARPSSALKSIGR